MTQQLPLCRYTFTVRAEQPLRLPEFAGSMLRGAFGNALRRVACMTRQKACTGCQLWDSCPYPMIFETPPIDGHALQKFSAMPNPYVIEPPQGGARVLAVGESFTFNMVLMGKALPQLPLIVLAWERALQHGLANTRSRCRLLAVHAEGDDEPIYEAGAGRVRSHQPAPVAPLTSTGRAVLEFTTPLRLQRQGGRVGLRELDARILLINLVRRHQLLCDGHLQQPGRQDFTALGEAASAISLKADMRWHDWTRYSSRQRQAMTLGGLVGKVELEGDIAPFADVLARGQWLHVGKNATFGLGHYRLC